MRYLSIFILLALSACSSTGTKVDQEKLSAFVKGKTTYSDVIQQLGKPDQSEINGDGLIIRYTYKETVAKAANFLPIVGGFIEAGAGSEDTTVTIRFNSKSVLTGYMVSELDENGAKKITKRQ